MAVLAKIGSGGSPGFNLDFYQTIWKWGHAVLSCPVSNGGKKAYLHPVDLFSAGSDRVRVSRTYCEQGSRC